MQRHARDERRNRHRRKMTGGEKLTNIALGIIAAIIAAYLGVDIDQYRQEGSYDSGQYMQHVAPE